MDGGTHLALGRIGPNAITRLAEALSATQGDDAARALFRAAGLEARLDAPPTQMVLEGEVTALHQALRARLPHETAQAIAADAGWRTGAYLLAHRIPRPMHWLLPRLPARWAARILLAAIGRHAWTFAGSGQFRVLPGFPIRFAISDGPLARGAFGAHPVCAYYAATFEALFRALVHPRTRVIELACEATGATACVFEARW